MRGQILLAAILGIASYAASAGEKEIAQCVALAREIAVGESESFTSTELDAMKYFATCEASKSGSKSSINIGYGAFSLGGGHDENEANSLCKKTREELGIKNTEYNKSKIFFARAMDTIDKCLTAAAQNWNVNYQRIQRDAVTIGLSNTGERGGDLKQVTIVPDSAMRCEGVPAAFPHLVTATNTVNLTCSRSSERQIVNGIIVESAKDATVILQLGANPWPITLPAYQGSVYDSLANRLKEIETTLYKVSARTLSIGSASDAERQAQPRVGGNNNGWTAESSCPVGYYVAGFVGQDHDKGGSCYDCMSRFNVICKPFKVTD